MPAVVRSFSKCLISTAVLYILLSACVNHGVNPLTQTTIQAQNNCPTRFISSYPCSWPTFQHFLGLCRPPNLEFYFWTHIYLPSIHPLKMQYYKLFIDHTENTLYSSHFSRLPNAVMYCLSHIIFIFSFGTFLAFTWYATALYIIMYVGLLGFRSSMWAILHVNFYSYILISAHFHIFTFILAQKFCFTIGCLFWNC